ncbi:hypothetical protein [Pectinatus frisingensis]|jgi:hypothetical protein|uniref:hypothetical protein n=1 Tax=Pectinatus frisingensis TaxID=865 RepID=UPI0018C73356|nr:hypothetical protein [Pectinatus frisingensis]
MMLFCWEQVMIAAVPDLCIGRIDAVPAAGYCKIAPNKVNTISGRIVFELDIRSMVEGKAKFIFYKQRYVPLAGYQSYVVIGNANDMKYNIYDDMANVFIRDLLPTEIGNLM